MAWGVERPTKELQAERDKEGGLLKFMRKRFNIHWDHLRDERDAQKIADWFNGEIREFLRQAKEANEDKDIKEDNKIKKEIKEE
jgi:hypothetical protein